MTYIGYSELTKRYYLLPRSKKESKLDITEDIKEILKANESPNPEQGIEAVEFARWITENDGEILDKDHWRFRNNTTHSTEHLYNLYKSVIKL